MPLTTRAVLSCMWPPPMDSQESFRYVQLADPGVSAVGWLSRSWFPGPCLGRPAHSSLFSSPRLCLSQAFKWIWKPEISKVSWSRPGLMWQAGWLDRADAQVQVPHRVHSTGLTPLHTAVLALNAAMLPPSVCPRMLTSQAGDRLACVQMLLQMGASHTSQVSLAGTEQGDRQANPWGSGGSVYKGPPRCPGAKCVISWESPSIFLHLSESWLSVWLLLILA